jgi:hypothetical protein
MQIFHFIPDMSNSDCLFSMPFVNIEKVIVRRESQGNHTGSPCSDSDQFYSKRLIVRSNLRHYRSQMDCYRRIPDLFSVYTHNFEWFTIPVSFSLDHVRTLRSTANCHSHRRQDGEAEIRDQSRRFKCDRRELLRRINI